MLEDASEVFLYTIKCTLTADPVRMAKASIQGLKWKQNKRNQKQEDCRKGPVFICLCLQSSRQRRWSEQGSGDTTSSPRLLIQHTREFSIYNTHKNQNQRPENDTRRCNVSRTRLQPLSCSLVKAHLLSINPVFFILLKPDPGI